MMDREQLNRALNNITECLEQDLKSLFKKETAFMVNVFLIDDEGNLNPYTAIGNYEPSKLINAVKEASDIAAKVIEGSE